MTPRKMHLSSIRFTRAISMYPGIHLAKGVVGTELAGWLWRHRHEIGEGFNQISASVMECLTNHDSIVGSSQVNLQGGQQKAP